MSALTKPEIQKFKKQLGDRGMDLRKAIHTSLLDSDNKTYAEMAGRVLDIGEQSMVDLLADVHIITLEKEVAELADVEAAVARIASGTYGQCADCGADIAVERLRIYPTARRCTECQMRHERMATDMTPSL
ncbi:MAG: TraR/DksA family transcriptional regulator [Acidiferrobacterales bacterium]